MWRPIYLDYLLSRYEPFDKRVLGSLIAWIVLIFTSIWISLYYLPDDWVQITGNRNNLLKFFLLNPSMLIGLLLLFWFGFEWSFIPVFMSMFVVGFFSHLPFYWAILFGLSFVFGLTMYAIVYYSLSIDYSLRSVSSIIVFIVTSFVASTASSLGAFIWSLAHDLSAIETATLWNGWWAGSFLQSLFIVGPILFVISPSIERTKEKWFDLPEKEEISTKWVYSAVILITIVIAIFIYSGDYLAKQRLAEGLMNMQESSKEVILSSLSSFEIITWVSIWIIICVGSGAVFLIGSWNKELQKKVTERTSELSLTQGELEVSLDEKVVLLQEIHHRVKNNLAVVTALLDLQYMKTENETVRQLLSDSKSRVKSMAYVHETLYQTEKFSRIELKPYVQRLCKSVVSTYKTEPKEIDIRIYLDEIMLELDKAIPVGLMLNELIVNAYKHAFLNLDGGRIEIEMRKEDKKVKLKVRDNGVGIDSSHDILKGKTLCITLIKTLFRQLRADLSVHSEMGNTEFCITFDEKIVV